MNIDKMTQFAFRHYQEGDLQQAKQICEQILRKKPNNFNALHLLGIIYCQIGNYDISIKYIRKALQNNPHVADAYFNLGLSLKRQVQYEQAITSYLKALQLNSNFAEANFNLGVILQEQFHYEQAKSYYEKTLQINPIFIDALMNLGNILRVQGKLDEAENKYRYALRINPNFTPCYSNLLFSMNYNSRYDTEAIYQEHTQFAKQIAETLVSAVPPYSNVRDPDRRLRIGYVSPDFRRHAVAYFIEPVLVTHSREHFEIFCYSNSLEHDELTGRLQEHADQWCDIVRMSDEEVAEQIRKNRIDILVDLAGHTAGNRILVFARKPAPIQVSWIGYLATTGLSTMDYKIVDSYTDPPGKTEQYYTEKLMRLPESFLCYQPDKDSPEVGPLPALSKKGHITFGSFNNFAKVTPEVFTLWARVLNELPDSRLLLKGSSFHDKKTCAYVRDMFAKSGISEEQIVLQLSDPSPKHLETYNQIDIGLDTFPFNGATTTCEALWMGVPVVTLTGTAYNASVGISLLSNIGLPELVAKTYDEYISIAVNLAADLAKLESLRKGLRHMMKCSPLCDAARFTENLEICYRHAWAKWCRSI